jgi:RNA polymerase sigma factor (sigma-70 family)
MIHLRVNNTAAGCLGTPASPSGWTSVVEAVRLKDEESMGMFYRKFQPGLRRLFIRQLGVDEAEDSVQHCICAAIAAIQRGGIDKPERLPAFVRGIAKRHIAERIAARVVARGRKGAPGIEARLIGKSQSPESIAAANQISAIAQKVLSAMKPCERAILTRFYMLEEPEWIICEALGITQQQFKNSKHRGKSRFAKNCQGAMNQHKNRTSSNVNRRLVT